MILKKAFIADCIALQKICIDAYSLNFHDHWNAGGLAWYLEREFSIERLTADLTNNEIDYFFIEHNQKIVGFIKMRDSQNANISETENAELEKIYVLPEYKGMGIGKWALNEIIERTGASGKKTLFLSVIDTNLNAIIFYKRLGFKFHSKTTLDVPYFKEELKGMYRMVKELNF